MFAKITTASRILFVFFLLSFINISFAQSPTLVGHWKLDETSGAVLNDFSGLNNHATLVNSKSINRITGVFGLALDMPGTTDRFATVPSNTSLNITSSISIAAWIKPTSNGNRAILSKAGTNGYEFETASNGKIVFRINGDANGNTYKISSNGSYPIDGNTWMHVAATFNGTSTKIYLNGVLDNSVTYPNPVSIISNSSPLYLGALIGLHRWVGGIDDIRLYSGALSAVEIQQIINNNQVNPPAAPVLLSPNNGAINIPLTQTLNWNAVSQATSYRVEVSSNPAFTSPEFATDLNATSTELTGLFYSQTYYWRVRANINGVVGNWSTAWSFTTVAPPPPSAPLLQLPANGAINVSISPSLSWNVVGSATSYQVQVSQATDFSSTVLSQENILINTFPLSNLNPGNIYYWRVRANNQGGYGAWSEGFSFSTVPAVPPSPVLIAPTNNATAVDLSPLLSWNTVSGASAYKVEVSLNGQFSPVLFSFDNITPTSQQLSNLAPGQVYYWHVLASNAGGNGMWSETRSFTTIVPSTLNLIHYWNFNGATVNEMLAPTLTLNNGSITESMLSTTTSEVGTGNGFVGTNARNNDIVGNHYRYNAPVGSTLTLNVPTTGYKDIIVKYETRRSTSGSEIQKISYTVDGISFTSFRTLNINNIAPELITLDFSQIANANDNANFKIKIEFEQGAGTLAGNNRFDNLTVEGNSLNISIPLPDAVLTISPEQNAQAVSLTPVVSWLPSANATTYELQVSTDNLFTNIVAAKSALSAILSYKLESSLSLATNYYWRMRGVNNTGNGPWSEVKTFQTKLQSTSFNLAINEAMSSNTNVITDEDGSYQDWIEIINYGSTPINLAGFGLTDLASTPFKWVFPSKTLAPGEFLIVWASNKNRVNPNLPLHTNFAISAQGEDLLITSPDGEWSDLLPSIAIPTNTSRGHQPDGTGLLKFFAVPTPGQPNINGTDGIITKVAFSQAPGLYASTISLTITHPDPSVTIRYTLDGSEPTQSSLLYQQPLQISDRSGDPNVQSMIPTNNITGGRGWVPPSGLVRKGTVVRAKAFKTNAGESPTTTGTYIVLNGRQYTLPVISVVAPSDSFFSFQRGIYVPGADYVSGNDYTGNYYQKGDSSERAGSIEFFSPELSFQQDLGWRINGNYSRRFPQKSLRVVAKSQYGKSTLDYPIFPNYSLSSFKRLVLSNSGNDWGYTMFKDALATRLINHIMPIEAFRPSIVFINGEYWGVHIIRERADKYFLGQKYGVDPDNIDHLSNQYTIEEGDDIDYKEMLNYIQNTDLTTDENFEGVKLRMDVDNFIDYMSAEIFYANNDWPQTNIEFWRAKVPGTRDLQAPPGQDGRWRWIFHDVDAGFGSPWFNSIEWVTSQLSLSNQKEWPNFLLRKLLTNQKFKISFINRMADHMNTAFVSSRMLQAIDSIKPIISPEMPEHILRWSRPSSFSGWNKYVDTLKAFATDRQAYMKQHIKNYFSLGDPLNVTLNVNNIDWGNVKVNSLLIDNTTAGLPNAQLPYPWQGSYFGNVPITLKGISKPGYVFDHWVINGQVVNNDAINYIPTANSSITAFFISTTGVVPILSSPANSAIGIAIANNTLAWNAVAGADSYRLQVSTNNDFSSTILDQSGITTTSKSISDLLYNTNYYWRVIATGPEGTSDWSQTWTFKTVPFPAIVNLVSPANGSSQVAINPTLTWGAIPEANNYLIQVSALQDFSALKVNQQISANTLAVSGLVRNQTYFWRVKASNQSGSSDWSTGTFSTVSLIYNADFVGHWDMNEESGATLYDKSIYSNHATLQTLNDVFRVPAPEGLGISLQGSTNRFAIAPNSPSLNITDEITIAAWIRPTSTGSQSILSKSGNDGYELAINSNGKIEFKVNPNTNGSTYRLYSNSNYPTNGITWMHVVATFNGSSSKIYINGVLDASVTFKNPTKIISNSSPLYIASLAGSRRWQGTLDDIQLYRRSLTAAEISELYSPTSIPAGSPALITTIPLDKNANAIVTPNPFSETFSIQFPEKIKTGFTISLVDVAGRIYYTSKQPGDRNQVQITLANTRLKAGVYFLVIKSPEYNTSIKVLKK